MSRAPRATYVKMRCTSKGLGSEELAEERLVERRDVVRTAEKTYEQQRKEDALTKNMSRSTRAENLTEEREPANEEEHTEERVGDEHAEERHSRALMRASNLRMKRGISALSVSMWQPSTRMSALSVSTSRVRSNASA